MAKHVWSGPRMFTTLDGNRELALTHIRDARIAIGFLLGQTSDLRPFNYRSYRLIDGSLMKVYVWRDNQGGMAKVRLWSPAGKEEEEFEALDVILFLASNTAEAGFDYDEQTEEYTPLSSANREINPIWVWTKNNKLVRFDKRGWAWNLQNETESFDTELDIVSLGKAMFYQLINPSPPTYSLGATTNLRLNEDIVQYTAIDYAFGFCIREAKIGLTDTEIVVVAGLESDESTDTLMLKLYSRASYELLGTAEIDGLFAWGLDEDTAYVKYVAFSKSGAKAAILVSLDGPSEPALYANLSRCAVFEVDLTTLAEDQTYTAVLKKEAGYKDVVTDSETDEVFFETGGVQKVEELVTYFEASGSYESPFMFEWDEEELTIYTAELWRQLARGYDVTVLDGLLFLDDYYWAGYAAAGPQSCQPGIAKGFYAGYANPQEVPTIVRSGVEDEVRVKIWAGTTLVLTHPLLLYENLIPEEEEWGSGAAGRPDVLEGEPDGCLDGALGGDPFDWFEVYTVVCDDPDYYTDFPECSYFAPGCDGQDVPIEVDLRLFGRATTKQILLSPLGCVAKAVGHVLPGQVEVNYYAEWINEGSTPGPFTHKEYVYNDTARFKYKGKTLTIGDRAAEGVDPVSVTIDSEATFRTVLFSTLRDCFAQSPEDVAMLVKKIGKNKKGEAITIATAHNADSEIERDGATIQLTGGGVVWHSKFGLPPGFPENTQACRNSVAPNFYTGTIATLET